MFLCYRCCCMSAIHVLNIYRIHIETQYYYVILYDYIGKDIRTRVQSNRCIPRHYSKQLHTILLYNGYVSIAVVVDVVTKWTRIGIGKDSKKKIGNQKYWRISANSAMFVSVNIIIFLQCYVSPFNVLCLQIKALISGLICRKVFFFCRQRLEYVMTAFANMHLN